LPSGTPPFAAPPFAASYFTATSFDEPLFYALPFAAPSIDEPSFDALPFAAPSFPASFDTTTSNVHSATFKRVKWTDAEVAFVGTWCEKTLRDNPRNATNIVARCLHYIKSDSRISAIFHPNHILNSGRLKHALDTYNDRCRVEVIT
jgi:hypothetical protein